MLGVKLIVFGKMLLLKMTAQLRYAYNPLNMTKRIINLQSNKFHLTQIWFLLTSEVQCDLYAQLSYIYVPKTRLVSL